MQYERVMRLSEQIAENEQVQLFYTECIYQSDIDFVSLLFSTCIALGRVVGGWVVLLPEPLRVNLIVALDLVPSFHRRRLIFSHRHLTLTTRVVLVGLCRCTRAPEPHRLIHIESQITRIILRLLYLYADVVRMVVKEEPADNTQDEVGAKQNIRFYLKPICDIVPLLRISRVRHVRPYFVDPLLHDYLQERD